MFYYDRTVECYDCHNQVYNLKEHRATCRAGRRGRRGRRAHPVQAIGVVQPVHAVPQDTVDFYGLLDVSRSMRCTKLDAAKSAFTQVFDQMREDDRISIITFDSNAYFKLKPRPVGQVRRQGEMAPLMARIYAKGLTALYDAVWMAVEQIRFKEKKTVIVVLTDGADNSSRHTHAELMAFVAQYPNVSVNIIHVDESGAVDECYKTLCEGRGEYKVISPEMIMVEVTRVFRERYLVPIQRIQ